MATGNQVLKAYSAAVKRFEQDPDIVAAEVSAGFIIPKGQKKGTRSGFQVFVKVYRYSEEVLADHPLSGGLLAKAPRRIKKKA